MIVPGDIVEVISCSGVAFGDGADRFIGLQGEVAGPAEFAPAAADTVGHFEKAFPVTFAGGERRWFIARCLRKVRGGRDDLRCVSWDDCVWRPARLPVSTPTHFHGASA